MGFLSSLCGSAIVSSCEWDVSGTEISFGSRWMKRWGPCEGNENKNAGIRLEGEWPPHSACAQCFTQYSPRSRHMRLKAVHAFYLPNYCVALLPSSTRWLGPFKTAQSLPCPETKTRRDRDFLLCIQSSLWLTTHTQTHKHTGYCSNFVVFNVIGGWRLEDDTLLISGKPIMYVSVM